MHHFWLGLELLLLLAVANNAPIATKLLLGNRWSWPLDGGIRLGDGRPLLGPSKTARGVVASVAACVLCAPLVGLSPGIGAAIGAAAMAADALSSFIKRRLAIEPSGRAFGLDQIPESLLPLLAVQVPLKLSLLDVAAITAAFVLLEVPLARIAHRVGFRDRPY
ncbi:MULTISPECIES: CDP-archaeol synthase [unclassified Variovorax]|uniref:CDP-archaeol synthase n=1 Tax=unclassified Variovorax TaxID=663243 RepID=UPI000D12F0DA|nr:MULTISPECIES: CDP-archaeol synthase [unclassified Variovorax]AVQ85614.1 CDP-archaeol synthase [Variovorax sp. PMC12]QRY35241.1 CDP-archaeol synthase [Variovorax sp. PDNC026]